MTITTTTAVKTAMITAERDYFANGTLELLTSADVLLASIPLSGTGGTISGAVWTLAFTGAATAGATGTAAKAQIKNSGGTAGITGLTVGTSGSDINLDSTSITSGQSVSMTSATITLS